MLELIVLGQVPGTGVVITFSWAVAIITVLTGVSLLRRVRRDRTVNHLVKIEEVAL